LYRQKAKSYSLLLLLLLAPFIFVLFFLLHSMLVAYQHSTYGYICSLFLSFFLSLSLTAQFSTVLTVFFAAPFGIGFTAGLAFAFAFALLGLSSSSDSSSSFSSSSSAFFALEIALHGDQRRNTVTVQRGGHMDD
jgi:hypothetical protein